MVRQTSSTRPRSMNCDCVLSSRELGYIPLDSCLMLLRRPFKGRPFTYLPSCFTRLVYIVQQILLFTLYNTAPLFLITYPWITSFVLYPLLHSLQRRSWRRIRPSPPFLSTATLPAYCSHHVQPLFSSALFPPIRFRVKPLSEGGVMSRSSLEPPSRCSRDSLT